MQLKVFDILKKSWYFFHLAKGVEKDFVPVSSGTIISADGSALEQL